MRITAFLNDKISIEDINIMQAINEFIILPLLRDGFFDNTIEKEFLAALKKKYTLSKSLKIFNSGITN